MFTKGEGHTCPDCKGTGRIKCPIDLQYQGRRNGWYGYNREDDSCVCFNCGGQYMFGTPTGVVPLNKHGNPCSHTYHLATFGKTLKKYTCTLCSDVYFIDTDRL